MSLFDRLHSSLQQHAKNKAFRIANLFCTYEELAREVAAVRGVLKSKEMQTASTIALIANDDLETYATILACWFEARTYVPVSPNEPEARRNEMIRLSGAGAVIDSLGLAGEKIPPQEPILTDPALIPFPENRNVYILFTSGSTGVPKPVPITAGNLAAFETAVSSMGMDLIPTDRWLQMFDLTFDLSIFSFLIPLLKGACVYTVPAGGVKYHQIFRLLDEQQLTVTLMVPSVLQFFQPYFEEIHNPALRYSLFCGEALPLQLVERWKECVPAAEIYNLYGPVEATIFCSSYRYPRSAGAKSFNGVVSIGRPLPGTIALLAGDSGKSAGTGETGNLFLSGGQITPGYLDSPEKNTASFITVQTGDGPERFYRTGDLCLQDSDGDLFYRGRTDERLKIQGFRVEPGEIEHFVREYFPGSNVVALAWKGTALAQIGIFIEGPEREVSGLKDYLKKNLPQFMIPAAIRFIPAFPLNRHGKTDRIMLQQQSAAL